MAVVALATLIGLGLWLSLRSLPNVARDFEECAEEVQDNASGSERTALMTNCSARFAGRRKAGGGYTYYDFMQNRSFDLAGPNPTAEEQKQIDLEYIRFLDKQRPEIDSVSLANKQTEKYLAELDGMHQPVGPPLVLTPNIRSVPVPAARPASRVKNAQCQEGPWACGWAKLSSAVKSAFASTPKTAP